ncbi:hypothetical protein MLD38_027587 [Melastoma candidum]|uniref:Uncharacterized protein n=1 Tax=Melastoma candidum TaxID=119954 RepID=A0ACB9P560_9MYRT|nr:hypothetical protein MLD38_027587 [Melastoma candidum]
MGIGGSHRISLSYWRVFLLKQPPKGKREKETSSVANPSSSPAPSVQESIPRIRGRGQATMLGWRTRRRRSTGKKGNNESDPVAYTSPSPGRSLFSSWFSKFKKSKGLQRPDSERDEGGSRFVPEKVGDPNAGTGFGNDEGFWRLSFGKDGGELQGSVCRSCLSIVEDGEAGPMKFNEMVSNVRRMRELRRVEQNFADIKLSVKERQGEKEPSLRGPRRIRTRAVQEPREALGGISSRNDTGGEGPPDGRELQRKSLYLTREVKSPRSAARRRTRHVKVSSPRLNSLVNTRRSRNGRDSRQKDGGEKDYERCAVVKCSYDPQGDFRDSMMEMIKARGIWGTAAEMEELLACYLTLNDDAYHDVIIKVFRQVWFELDEQGFWSRGDRRYGISQDQQTEASSG